MLLYEYMTKFNFFPSEEKERRREEDIVALKM